ncbi:TPA: DnaD domain-containing protein [Streptococcus mutans]|uniref:DnaD domain-containing protein n=1 Tax=Streptococcus mutans TaxID=1309 RepID=UPI0002B50942|nr:DnaD domain-containing protein [Streptococcus mutans]EMB61987.1 DNA replication protein DnaD [Streptococcus mutans 15JP3]EMB68389.1 DNA replication protein DnaD [Streptococcus mutans 2ST1]EMC20741.1 DNA replication protein DnaD [Streptococcus mutans SF1]EMC37175.1 DNA replication protein DnaD [Streptococcus mutans 21]EMC45925.1 DNA replication protein DnaD [Streptococcus mutans SM4]
MSFLQHYKSGNLVLPSALLFHYKDIFSNADDFLVWQFFYFQNTTKMEDIATSQIATAIGKTVPEVNRSVSNLISQELLDMKTIELDGESEVLFDATLALKKLDDLLTAADETTVSSSKGISNALKDLVEDFERELGRMLSPFELEDLQKTVSDDKTDPDLVRAALREAVFNGKTNWNYIQAILRNWRREGISTLRQVEERRKEREQANPANVTVSDDFLSAMNLWSDSDAR